MTTEICLRKCIFIICVSGIEWRVCVCVSVSVCVCVYAHVTHMVARSLGMKGGKKVTLEFLNFVHVHVFNWSSACKFPIIFKNVT